MVFAIRIWAHIVSIRGSCGLFPRLCRIKGLGHVSGASRCFLRLHFRSIKTVVQYKIHPTKGILLGVYGRKMAILIICRHLQMLVVRGPPPSIHLDNRDWPS